MTIEEAKKKKECLEVAATKLIHEFTRETGLPIEEIIVRFAGTTPFIKIKVAI